MSSCDVCDVDMGGTCSSCGASVCEGCIRSCSACGEEYCTNCYDDTLEKCLSCKAEDMEEEEDD